MNAKSVAERVSEHRARLKSEGLVKLELWVHQNDVTRIKRDAEAHAARRARALKKGLVISSIEDEEARLVATAKRIKAQRKE